MELTKYKHLINLLLHNTALIQHPTMLYCLLSVIIEEKRRNKKGILHLVEIGVIC